MLDLRVYRTAFLPALVALFVAAFSLEARPAPVASALAADAFDAVRAYASLQVLGRAFPRRGAGSPDDAGLADVVARTLSAVNPATRRPDFDVERLGSDVVATRPGLTSRRVVVLAHRDAVGAPALASLSGTAALLELARVFRGADLRRTLVLVSTSGATTGFSGARAWARAPGGPVDAVLVLGDLAGRRVRKPWVVPWSADGGPPPLALQRTLEAAVRAEVGADPGGAHASGQWARRALPVTVSEQGAVNVAGIPAVLLGVSGERGPGPAEPVLRGRLDDFGRAALRALGAIDAAGGADLTAPAFASSPAGIVTARNLLPDWAVRMLVGTLLLPALLAALDGFFRARRRRAPVGACFAWLALCAVPVLAAWAWLRLLGMSGALGAPSAFVLPDAYPLRGLRIAAFLSVPAVAALAWWGARGLLGARRPPRATATAGGLSAATGVTICGAAALVWVPNPFAAALLLPASHLWLFAAAPSSRVRGWRAAAVVALGVAPVALVALHFAGALGLDPLQLAWAAALAAAGGALAGTALWIAAVAASLAGLLAVMRARTRAARFAGPHEEMVIRTRGPRSYAGPGSLGGTESALRR